MSESREFDAQPTLAGALVEIRPIVEADREPLQRVASDPRIWEQHPASDRWKPEAFAEFFDGALRCGGGLTIVARASGRIIGSSRYHAFDAEKRVVEIGWTFLAREYWGGEFNGEVKSLMLEHAFRFVDCVALIIGDRNHRSRRAAEKIGAVQAGEAVDSRGNPSLRYEVRRSEWIARHTPPS